MPVGGGGAWRTTSRRTTTQSTSGAAGLEGTGGSGGPGCDARGRRRGPDKSRMQFKNTSDVTLQTDTNQHDTRGELHAKLRNDGHLSANHAPPAWRASEDRRRGRGAGGRRQGLAGQRVDAPSEARSADGGRAAAHEHTKQPGTTSNATGGPPPTGTPSSPAPQPGPPPPGTPAAPSTPPEHQRRNTPPRHSKAARPRRGRAAQPVSEDHRRTTTMSGLPRPLSWRTFEMPSFDAMSLAVPSMRGSS